MLRFLAFLLLVPLAAACATTPPAAPAFTSERIAVEVHGEGPDVVLIPGLSSSPRVWDSTIAALPGYRYHVVHVAGFAGKPAGANASGPVLAPVGEEIARYIREARLERPAIVGHSMGGSWAMMVAGRHPGLVRRAMVVDMMPFMGALFGGPGATAESVRPVAEQIRAGMRASPAAGRRAMIEQTIAGMIRTESRRAAAIEQSLASDPAVSSQGFYDLIVTDLTPDLANIQVPLTVLYVQPTGAPLTEAQLDQFYAAAYRGVRTRDVRRIADAAHFIMFDQPEAFQRELRTFLAADR